MNKIEAVLFDLDGTLLDSAPDFHLVINEMLQTRNRDLISLAALKHQVSNGARAMVKYAFAEAATTIELESLKAEFLALYFERINQKSYLYAGIEQVISFLETNHISWGIVTNKPEYYTTPIITHFPCFAGAKVVICPDHVKHTKPDPEPLFLACEKMSISADKCCYIGDHERDIIAGKAANMYTIGCNYGYLNENEDSSAWQADALVDQPLHIIEQLKTQLA
ncbi:MAG: HAD-IA family hydrolase [Oceanospirillaceae bacterium]